MEAIKRKLPEAEFFLRLMREQTGRIVRNEPEAERFYLSAFLSAAISLEDYIWTPLAASLASFRPMAG